MHPQEWARRYPELAAELDSAAAAPVEDSAGCWPPLGELAGAVAVVGVALVVLLYGRYALGWGGDGVAIAIGAVGVMSLGVLAEFTAGVFARLSVDRSRQEGSTDGRG